MEQGYANESEGSHEYSDDERLINDFATLVGEYNIVSSVQYDLIPDAGKPSRRSICRVLGNWNDALAHARYLLAISDGKVDIDIIREAVRQAKDKQRYMDVNRVERKAFRTHARAENAVCALSDGIKTLLEGYDMPRYTLAHDVAGANGVGIIHFTDAHFNERVDLPFNEYGFETAAARCRKYIREAKRFFSLYGIQNVLFAMTGDMLNSDRRLDELLTNATNRSKALFLATSIVEQMILDLNRDYNVTVTAVSGNESRINDAVGYVDPLITDNYDFSLFRMLAYKFDGAPGIAFDPPTNYNEHVVNVCGKGILLLHGSQLKDKYEVGVQRIMGKYAARGQSVYLTLVGHLHSARIGDTYARGGSVVGANAYSDSGLQLISRASQNAHVVFPGDAGHHSFRVDLQDVSDITDPYVIIDDLKAYNAKSEQKLHARHTILEITV